MIHAPPTSDMLHSSAQFHVLLLQFRQQCITRLFRISKQHGCIRVEEDGVVYRCISDPQRTLHHYHLRENHISCFETRLQMHFTWKKWIREYLNVLLNFNVKLVWDTDRHYCPLMCVTVDQFIYWRIQSCDTSLVECGALCRASSCWHFKRS